MKKAIGHGQKTSHYIKGMNSILVKQNGSEEVSQTNTRLIKLVYHGSATVHHITETNSLKTKETGKTIDRPIRSVYYGQKT